MIKQYDYKIYKIVTILVLALKNLETKIISKFF